VHPCWIVLANEPQPIREPLVIQFRRGAMPPINMHALVILAIIAGYAQQPGLRRADLKEGEEYRRVLRLSHGVKGNPGEVLQPGLQINIQSTNAKGEFVAEIRTSHGFAGIVRSVDRGGQDGALILSGNITNSSGAPRTGTVELKLTSDKGSISGSFHLEYPDSVNNKLVIEEVGDLEAKRVPTIIGAWKGAQNTTEVIEFAADKSLKIK
jgi:hypothetical protein